MNVCCLFDGGLPIRSTAHSRNGPGFTIGCKLSAGTLCMDPFHSTSENRAILAFESCPIGSITSSLKLDKKRREGQETLFNECVMIFQGQ